AAPGDRGIDPHRLGDEGRAVALVRLQVLAIGADTVAEHGVVPAHHAIDRAGVRVEQELRGIEAMPGRRLVRSGHTIAVPQAGARLRQVAVPDLGVALLEPGAGDFAVAVGPVEETEVDARRVPRGPGAGPPRSAPR